MEENKPRPKGTRLKVDKGFVLKYNVYYYDNYGSLNIFFMSITRNI